MRLSIKLTFKDKMRINDLSIDRFVRSSLEKLFPGKLFLMSCLITKIDISKLVWKKYCHIKSIEQKC